MSKLFFAAALVLFAVVFSSVVDARDCGMPSCSDTVKILYIRPVPSHQRVYFQLKSSIAGKLPKCNQLMYSVDLTRPAHKELVALLLTALTSDREISLEFSNLDQCGKWGDIVSSLLLF